jgi:transcriptional regulator with XRE-family HTH domain
MAADIIKSEKMGEAIRKRRKELGFSQEQLAEMVGMSYQQIQRYESGYSMINVENIQRIAKILNLPATSFFAPDQQQTVADPSLPYATTDEKTLLRHYRDLSTKSDRHLAIAIVRRIARK